MRRYAPSRCTPVPQREDGTVQLACDLELALGVTRVIGGDQVLAPVFDPFHRASEPPCCVRDEKVFRIELAANPERAAGVAFHHLHVVDAQVEVLRQHAAVRERHLAHAEHAKLSGACVPVGEQPPSFHGKRGMAVNPEALTARIRGEGKGRVGVPSHGAQRESAVAIGRLEKQGPVPVCDGAIDDHR